MAYKGPGAADCEDAYGAINQAAGSAKVRQVKIEALETAVKAVSAVNRIDPTGDRQHRRQGRTRSARPHQNRRDRHQRCLDRMSASNSLFFTPHTRHQAWERGRFRVSARIYPCFRRSARDGLHTSRSLVLSCRPASPNNADGMIFYLRDWLSVMVVLPWMEWRCMS